MGTTPTYSWPYPEPTDPVANGAQDIEDLALAVESTVSGITGGKILQVVSTTHGSVFSTTSTSFVAVTGLSVSITPSSATSNVFVIVSAHIYTSSTNAAWVSIFRDSVATGTNLGDSTDGFGVFLESTSQGFVSASFLDSPATTSATTYDTAVKTNANTVEIMRGGSYSTITAIEVSP